MEYLIADIEADGLLPTVSEIFQLSIIPVTEAELSQKEDWTPEFLKTLKGRTESYNAHGSKPLSVGYVRLAMADKVVFHHGLGYDLPAIEKVEPGHGPAWEKVVDTLVLSRLGNPTRDGGHSLAVWGERLGYAKPEHTDWTKWSPAMEHRCGEDVMITAQLLKRLWGMYAVMPKAIELEHAMAWEVSKMLRRGFRLNVKKARAMASEMLGEMEEIREELRVLFPPILVPKQAATPVKKLKVVNKKHPLHGALDPGVEFCPVEIEEFNPGSRQQIAKRIMRTRKWKPSKFTPTGQPDVSEEVLADLPWPETARLSRYLTLEKRVGYIQAEKKRDGTGGGWLQHVDEDGRVRANLNPCGTVTGRPTAKAPPIQCVDKDSGMRSAWFTGLGVDAEGLELRCLAHYLARYDGGAYAKELVEGDVHARTAHAIGLDLVLPDEDPEVYKKVCRDSAKRVKYAFIYGAGDPKLGQLIVRNATICGRPVNFERLGIKPTKKLGAIGKAARAKLFASIPGLEQLAKDVRKAAMSGKIRGIDGRSLWIRSPHSALNFLLQSAGAVVMKQAAAIYHDRLNAGGFYEDEDYGMVMWVHDEFQFELYKTDCATLDPADPVGRITADCIKEAGELLDFRCPLAGAFEVGPTWADTH